MTRVTSVVRRAARVFGRRKDEGAAADDTRPAGRTARETGPGKEANVRTGRSARPDAATERRTKRTRSDDAAEGRTTNENRSDGATDGRTVKDDRPGDPADNRTTNDSPPDASTTGRTTNEKRPAEPADDRTTFDNPPDNAAPDRTTNDNRPGDPTGNGTTNDNRSGDPTDNRTTNGTGSDRAAVGGVRERMSGLRQGVRAARPVDAVRREAGSAGEAVRAAWRGPGRERDLVVQSLKAAVAAVLAWLVGGVWMGDPLALMAPWVALVLVQATVYSSLLTGARQFGAICVGTVLASVAQAITGDTTGALALSIPVLMLLANWPRFGDQGIYAATTALFTLTAGSVTMSSVGHRVGQAALGAVIGVAVNALVLPPIHLRDVRENLAALARESGDVLRSVAGDLREGEWDAQTAAGWLNASKQLDRRLDALRSARRWSQESLRLTYGPLRMLHRVSHMPLPPPDEDERLSRITGHVTALTRALAVAVDDKRTPTPPDGPALQAYADMLSLIGEACQTEADRLLNGSVDPRHDGETDREMRKRQERVQESLREHAGQGASHTAVLGTLLLQAENLWAEIVPDHGEH